MTREHTGNKDVPHVILTLKDGILAVLTKPEGIRLTLMDYDVEGEMAGPDCEDPQGAACCLREWSSVQAGLSRHHWPSR